MSTATTQTILIVDDVKELTDRLVAFFAKQGWNAHGAYSGVEGLEIFIQLKPNIVLLDIGLPGESGLEVLPQMKAVDPDACILILTGRVTIDNCREAFRNGAWDFISKPIESSVLLGKVQFALLQYQTRIQGSRASELLGFTRAVSHSLKNRMDTFRVLSLMIRDENDRVARHKLYDKLNEHCEDYRSVLDRLNRFARLEAPDAHEFNLALLFGRVAQEAAERFERLHFGPKPSIVLETQEVEVHGDAVLIAEVLDTMLTNAFEASSAANEVVASLSVEGDLATVTVRDCGEGFRPEVLERIGKGWVSTRTGQGNYGIGLFMASKVARYYRGQLKASNRTDRSGAQVEFSMNINHQPPTDL